MIEVRLYISTPADKKWDLYEAVDGKGKMPKDILTHVNISWLYS